MAKRSAKRATAALASGVQREPPTMNSGRRASAISATNRSMSSAPGAVSATVAAGRGASTTRSFSMSLGRLTTTGPWPAAAGDDKGAVDDLGHAGGVVDLDRQLGHRAEYRLVVELLERLPLAKAPLDLPDEHDHRCRILVGDVNAGRGVGGARTARHEADAGPARRLAHRLGHHRGAAFLAADGDGDVAVVEGVEHAQETLAGHAEDVTHAIGDQLVDEHLGGGAGW